MNVRARRAAVTLSGGAIAFAMVLTGCSGPAGEEAPTGSITPEEFDEAMSTPTELTFWTWVPNIEDEVALFEAEYPEISVTVENVGQGGAEYTALRTALEAGDGAPDVAQIEYQQISSFALTNDLLDLTPYGAADLGDQYVPWVWNQVAINDQIFAIPQDTGPMGSLYRSDIYDAAGITEAPETWDDFREAAAAVRSTGAYIANLEPDPGALMGLFWQAGAKPFGYDGKETVTIDVNSAEAKKVMEYWQGLIDDDLVAHAGGFNDEWYQSINAGLYAGWLTAAWGPLFLQGTAESTAGKWTAAPLPQWSADDPASGNWGGSSNAVLATSKNPIAAYELARFINTELESTLMFSNEQFLFPAANAVLEDEDWRAQESEFFGGQEVNALFADVSGTVDTEFQWLPFTDYAFSSFADTVGAAILSGDGLVDSLETWQSQLETYAVQQGFTVK